MADAIVRLCIVIGLMLFASGGALAGSVNLAWDPVPSASVAGYIVHYGPSAGTYTSTVDVGNVTTRTVSSLVEGSKYYFAVAAYDASRVESPLSNEVSATVPFAAPAASFTASTTSGTAPLALNFINTSTGTITSYAWNFGDATASTVQNPSKAYSTPGVFTVALTVSGPGGSNTMTRTSYITVSAPASAPVAAFAGVPTSGRAPLTVNFTNASTGSITSYAWNFGDGTTSTAQNPVKVYSNAGVYTVSLTVTGPGGSNTKTMANYVNVAAPVAAPVAAFTGSPTSGTAPMTVNFTSASTGSITSYAWSFGDGTTSTAPNPVKVYSTPGVYSVALTVTGAGGSNTLAKSGYVSVGSTSTAPPVAAFSTWPKFGSIPLSVAFTNKSTGVVTSYAWDFGDGTKSTAQNPVKVYSFAGVYTVTLTVSGPGGTNTLTKADLITASSSRSTPVAAFSASPTSGTGPLTVKFTSAATGNITSYAWNFGDGTTSTAQNPTKVYSTPGAYSVSLTVTGISGGSNKLTNSNYITVTGPSQPAPVAAFTASATSGEAPMAVSFTSTSTGSISSYAWNFGDGTTSSVQNPVQVYSKAGVYSVSLTVSGPGGTSTKSMPNHVTVTTPPPTVACSPCTIWPSTLAPTLGADPDTSPVELGVRFKSDISGYISGIRFYKSAANTGTHVGSLWTSSGSLLGRATFSSETASGWQTVYFSSPVPIAAGVVYVASYHTNTGRYANDNGYFAARSVDSGPLHALADVSGARNGVYAYGSTPAFPTNSYEATNYWVDVIASYPGN